MRAGFALLLGMVLASCSVPKEAPSSEFVMKNFKLESPGGCASDSVTCASFEVDYPEFTRLDTAVQHSIDEKINYWLGGGIDGEVKSLTILGNDFVRDFEEFQKGMPGFGLGWYYEAKVNVMISSDTLISLQIDTDMFTGGAHGSYSTGFVNVDPKTGTPYLLDALLKPGYESLLNGLGEEDFRKQQTMDDADSLAMEGFSFEEDQFQLNDNYGFRKEGIVFLFNSYEIAAYAEGPTEILIPYERLAGWFK